MSRTWYVVRHGETEWNAAARIQGQLDSPLTALGRQHAKNTARLLARLGVDLVFASPLGRVRETVAIIAEDVSLTATYDDRLKEWAAGAWSGERHADLAVKWPREWAAWEGDRHSVRSPGGENFADLADRARAFLADAAAVPGERVAIIGHGYMNRALASVLLSLSPAEMMSIRQSNDTVIRIVDDGHAPVVDHFAGAEGPFSGLPGDLSHTQQTA